MEKMSKKMCRKMAAHILTLLLLFVFVEPVAAAETAGMTAAEATEAAGVTAAETTETGTEQAAEVTLQESELYSKACALVDGDSGRLLYGKNESTMLPNASTTKILTCIIAMEECGMDEVVSFSAEAAAQPKVHLGVKEGAQFYLGDLLYGLMLESYNDCAWAIAEHVAGSVEAFADRMNEKAEAIGCTDTHFVTPNGLDAEDDDGEHHTTAYDLCRIMSYCAWESPASAQFLALTQTRSYSFNGLDGTGYAVSNKNAFLDMMDEAITGKTGYTSKAGYCYVAAIEEGGRRFAIALLACGWPNNRTWRWSDAKTLFSYGMENYHLYQGREDIFSLDDVETGSGYRDGTLSEWGVRTRLPLYVNVNAEETDLTFLKADWEEASVRKTLTRHVQLPVQAGDVLGTVSYGIEGDILYTYDICAADTIFQWDFLSFLRALFKEFLL
jgi:D-alanyl-D-alanine carboxypeptidase (penicillin-binding protein 5/6)